MADPASSAGGGGVGRIVFAARFFIYAFIETEGKHHGMLIVACSPRWLVAAATG
jgi:hypothetical protein